MPRDKRTNPAGQSSGTGEGLGQTPEGGIRTCGNRIGRVGRCVCPQCGALVHHQRGVPCKKLKCVKCGSKMVRE